MDWMSDAVSRFIQSPSYLQPLLEFIDENCALFQHKQDKKLDHTCIHNKFKQLADGLISDFLTSLEVPVHQFVQNLARHIHKTPYAMLLTSILTVDDLCLFKEMMLKRNSQLMDQLLNDEESLYDPMDDGFLEGTGSPGLESVQGFDLEEAICQSIWACKQQEHVQAKESTEVQDTAYLAKNERQVAKMAQVQPQETDYSKTVGRFKSARPPNITYRNQALVQRPLNSDETFVAVSLNHLKANIKEPRESKSTSDPQATKGRDSLLKELAQRLKKSVKSTRH